MDTWQALFCALAQARPPGWRLLALGFTTLLASQALAGEPPRVEPAGEADASLIQHGSRVEVLLPSDSTQPVIETVVVTDSAEPGVDTSADTPPVLRLEDAIAAALNYSPGLTALQWQAFAQWEQAKSVLGRGGLATEFSILGMQTDSPLGVFGGKLSQGRVTQQDFDPARLNDPDFFGNVEYKLKVMYPLFTSGRIELLADALKLNSQALDFDRLRAQHDLTGKVIETYFAHDLLNEQLAVLHEAEQTMAELLRLIESLEREGLVVKADIAAAEVEVANIANELNLARANLELTENVLALLMGAPRAPFTSEITLDPADLALPTLDEVTLAALEHRPDLLAMERRVCAATNVLDEAIRKRNPTLGAFAEGKHASPGLPGQGHTEATVGAQLTLDLDTAGVIRHEVEQKRADLAAAQAGYEQLKDLAKIDVAQAYNELVKAHGSLALFQAQGAKAAQNLRVVRNRYREGLTNYLDVRMAVTTLKESRLRELNSHYSLLLAYEKMLVATGEIGSEQDPFLNQPEAGGNAVLKQAADEHLYEAQPAPGGSNDAK